eukprot:1142205-Pelagomonas_calceolata.AAC.2
MECLPEVICHGPPVCIACIGSSYPHPTSTVPMQCPPQLISYGPDVIPQYPHPLASLTCLTKLVSLGSPLPMSTLTTLTSLSSLQENLNFCKRLNCLEPLAHSINSVACSTRSHILPGISVGL